MAKEDEVDRYRISYTAIEILQNRPVISVLDFEDELLDRHPELDKITGSTGAGRSRKLNHIDWVKSELTQRGLIRYLTHHDTKFIVYLEPRGNVEGSVIVYMDDVESLLVKLVEALSLN